MTTSTVDEQELRELGLTGAADQVGRDRELARKLRIAFEHFRIVEPDKIERFKKELKAKTLRKDGKNQWGNIEVYDTLKLTPLENYRTVPPKEALDELKKAQALKCFDSFAVATIESVRIVPDPIIFGKIVGSPNLYYVCQWDNDVSIEDILRSDEG